MPSLRQTAAEQGVAVPPWAEVDFAPLALPEEQALIKRLLQYPGAGGGRGAGARAASRGVLPDASWPGSSIPYYKAHRVITDDRAHDAGAARASAPRSGQVVRNGLDLLGVSAPESM